MIEIDPINLKIKFEARKGLIRANKPLELHLISGHYCPVCNNIIQAIFESPEKVDTYPYEEVNILKLDGEDGIGTIQEILPNDKHKRKNSCYNVVYDSNLKYQKITLKNHILKMKAGVNKRHNGEHIYETGPRPCLYSGLYSLSEEILTKDFIFFSGQEMSALKGKKMPPLDLLAPTPTRDDSYYKKLPAIGKGQSVILIRTLRFIYGYNHYFEPQLTKYLKEL